MQTTIVVCHSKGKTQMLRSVKPLLQQLAETKVRDFPYDLINEIKELSLSRLQTSITVETMYTAYCSSDVELPVGYTPDDIEEIWMKWGCGEIEFKDGTTFEFEENQYYDPDTKRPDLIRAYLNDEDGNTNWDQEVFSDG